MVHGCWAISSGTPWASALSRQRPEQAMARPRELLHQLLERRDLSQAQAEELLAHLTDPQLPPAMAGGMLAALSTKGLVAGEVRGYTRAWPAPDDAAQGPQPPAARAASRRRHRRHRR